MHKFLFLFSLLFATGAVNVMAVPDAPLDELLADSSLWSFHVRVDPEEVSPELRMAARFPGILLRIEGDAALIDFGRDGTHRIPIDQTNLLEEAGRIKRGEAELDLPNFTRYTANIFFRKDVTGVYRPYPVDEYASTLHFLIVYGDECLVENRTIREAIDDLFVVSNEKGAMNVVMPTTHRFYEVAIQAGIDWILPFAHSRLAFVDALHHDPEEDAITVMLIDAYGKILERAVFSICEAPVELGRIKKAMAEQSAPLEVAAPLPAQSPVWKKSQIIQWLKTLVVSWMLRFIFRIDRRDMLIQSTHSFGGASTPENCRTASGSRCPWIRLSETDEFRSEISGGVN